MTTPEKSLQRMLNTTGLSSESDAEAGSKEEEADDDDDEPDLDALATRLSAKVGLERAPKMLEGFARTRPKHPLVNSVLRLGACGDSPSYSCPARGADQDAI